MTKTIRKLHKTQEKNLNFSTGRINMILETKNQSQSLSENAPYLFENIDKKTRSARDYPLPPSFDVRLKKIFPDKDVRAIVSKSIRLAALKEFKPFYKFSQDCSHDSCRENDTWISELELKPKTFNRIFDQSGIRYPNRKTYDAEIERNGDPFQGNILCAYYDRSKNKRYFLVNLEELERIYKLVGIDPVQYGIFEGEFYPFKEELEEKIRDASRPYFERVLTDDPLVILTDDIETLKDHIFKPLSSNIYSESEGEANTHFEKMEKENEEGEYREDIFSVNAEEYHLNAHTGHQESEFGSKMNLCTKKTNHVTGGDCMIKLQQSYNKKQGILTMAGEIEQKRVEAQKICPSHIMNDAKAKRMVEIFEEETGKKVVHSPDAITHKCIKSLDRNFGSLKEWRIYCRRISTSKFLMGECPPKDGMQPFDLNILWALLDGNIEKIRKNGIEDGGFKIGDRESYAFLKKQEIAVKSLLECIDGVLSEILPEKQKHSFLDDCKKNEQLSNFVLSKLTQENILKLKENPWRQRIFLEDPTHYVAWYLETELYEKDGFIIVDSQSRFFESHILSKDQNLLKSLFDLFPNANEVVGKSKLEHHRKQILRK